MRPQWWSQPFPPDGTVASEGIRRQLGTPELDPLTVMVRETAQNSWDARSDESGVRLTYELCTLTEERGRVLRDLLLPGPDGDDPLAGCLQPGALLLTISDRGTTGLGGELRSDVPGSERPDFVNFVRNVGEARSGGRDGGTYGFGKAILFTLSRANTVIISTRCRYRNQPQRRLIGAMVGASHERGGRRYTGRHWWGVVAGGKVVDPLLDEAAEEVADELGLPEFRTDELGTDLLIVAPTLGEVEDGQRGLREAADLIASSVLWNLWPKLVAPPGADVPMRVRVVCDGEEIPLADPVTVPGLGCFVRAFRALDTERGQSCERSREPRLVGRIGGEPAFEAVPSGGMVAACAPFEGLPRHCARMRSVGLVVDYLEGPIPDDPRVGYAAVFRSSPAADPHFAAAEPPTHDSWHTKHLSGADLGVVRGANRFIREELRRVAGLDRPIGEASAVPLGALGNRLARLLPTTSAEGATDGDGGESPEGGAGRSLFTWVRQPHLEVVDEEAVVAGTVRVLDSTATIVLRADAKVGIEGGTEDEPPIGAVMPEVLGWRSPEGPLQEGGELRVGSEAPRAWTVVVRPVPGTATAIGIRAEVDPGVA